jgi:hypothetical protein
MFVLLVIPILFYLILLTIPKLWLNKFVKNKWLIIILLLLAFLIGLFLVSRVYQFSYFIKSDQASLKFVPQNIPIQIKVFLYLFQSSGPLFILAPIGLIYLFIKKNNIFFEYFFIMNIIILALFITDVQYFFQFSLIWYSLLIGYGCLGLSAYTKIKYLPYVLILFLFTTHILLSGYVLLHQSSSPSLLGAESWLKEDTYRAALYYQNLDTNKAITSNDFSNIQSRFSAISNKPFAVPADRLYLLYDFEKAKSMQINRKQFLDFILSPQSLWYVEEPDIFRDRMDLYYRDLHSNRTNHIIDSYDIGYLLENNNVAGKYAVSWTIANSPFVQSVHSEKSKIYDNERLSIWNIER